LAAGPPQDDSRYVCSRTEAIQLPA